MRKQLSLSHFSGPDGFERYIEMVEDGKEGELLAELAVEIAREQGYVTADDLRHAVESLGIRLRKSYNIFGAILASLKRKGILRIAGYTPSEVPTSHARPIAIFVLNEGGDPNA
jgi:argininosuccinate lyase